MPESNTNGKDLPNGSVVADRSKSTKRSHKSGKMVPQKPYLIAIIVLAVLAVAGAGFGVAELVINSHSDQNKAQLEQTGDQDDKTDGADEDDHVADDDKDIAGETEGFTVKNLLIRHDKLINQPYDDVSNYDLIAENTGVTVQVSAYEKGTLTPEACETGNGDRRTKSTYEVSMSVNWGEVKDIFGIKHTGREDTGTFEIKDIDASRIVDLKIGSFGHLAENATVLFLMDDGTVEYIPLKTALRNGDIRSYGKLDGVDGVVRLSSVVTGGCTGYATVIAQKANGDFYDLVKIVEK